MRAVPLTLKQANNLVENLHRHHKPVRGHRFSIGCESDGELVGAVIVGRPVARGCDPYNVAEVTRLVSDGTKNVSSFLYARASRAAAAMGFLYIQTYTLPEEGGVSLRASGWKWDGETSSTHRWTNRKGRRTDQPVGSKWRWVRILNKEAVQ